MISLIDFILNLFRDDHAAQAFVVDPEQALLDAGLPNVTSAQIQSVAATAVPSLALGNGDPVVGLQTALTNHYGWEPVIAPSPTWAPTWSPQTDLLSGNQTDLMSHNNTPIASPVAGGDVQQGGFNLGFGDITLFGSHTSANGENSVAVAGSTHGAIVTGDGAVLGNANSVNNGSVHAGHGSNVNVGQDNTTNQGNTAAGHDVVTNHDGSVIQTSHGTTNASQGNTDWTAVHGNQTTTDIHGTGNTSGVDNTHTVDNSSGLVNTHLQTNTHDIVSTPLTDNSVHDNPTSYSAVHADSSSTYAPTHETTTVDSHAGAPFDMHHGF